MKVNVAVPGRKPIVHGQIERVKPTTRCQYRWLANGEVELALPSRD